jgi:hypothetical protein
MEACGYRIGDELNQPMECVLDTDDGHRTHRTDGGYIFSTEQSLRYESELERDEYIATLRGELKTALKNASSYLLGALTVVQKLKSKEVYDIEFAECESHIEHAIREAGLFTAAAQAMSDVLLK